MSDPTERRRLEALEARIAAAREKVEPARKAQDRVNQSQMAWRMVTELVAGIVIGFGIGLGLDSIFGTRPWLLVTFTLLGFAAGVRTMMQTARDVQARAAGESDRAARQEDGTGG